MHAALVLGQRDERSVPAVRAQAAGVVHRQAGVVAEFGAEETIGPVLVKDSEVVPHTREVHLRVRRPCVKKVEKEEKKKERGGNQKEKVGFPAAGGHGETTLSPYNP